ncbi:MAG: RecX family transcriptional regulator [Cellulosilyticaceae bacterium]
MLEITDIQEQKKDTNRVSVFIDGEFKFGMFKSAVKRYGIHIGMRLSEDDYRKLLEAIELDKAKYRALDYISYQNRSEKEIRSKLRTLEYSELIIEQVIQFLKKYSYINDEDFAKKFTEYNLNYKRKSMKRIQYELYQKGISGVELEELVPNKEQLEYENIEYLLKKYKYNKEMDRKEKEKLIRRILSKGFSYSIVKECMYKIDESFDD